MKKTRTSNSPIFPFFQAMPAEKARAVIAGMSRQRMGKNQIIYERGEDCTDAFFIFEGRVKFCTYGSDGKLAYFYHRTPGSIFGFHSAISGLKQTTTATVSEDALIGRMSGHAFMDLVLGHRSLSEYMLKLVTGLLRAETGRVTRLITMDARRRVAAELLEMAAMGGNVVSPPERVDMAARLGLTRETLARHLSFFSKKKLIRLTEGQIHIIDVNNLAAILD